MSRSQGGHLDENPKTPFSLSPPRAPRPRGLLLSIASLAPKHCGFCIFEPEGFTFGGVLLPNFTGRLLAIFWGLTLGPSCTFRRTSSSKMKWGCWSTEMLAGKVEMRLRVIGIDCRSKRLLLSTKFLSRNTSANLPNPQLRFFYDYFSPKKEIIIIINIIITIMMMILLLFFTHL